MLMANSVSQLAAKTPGKEAAAMEAFAAALRQVQINKNRITIYIYLQYKNTTTLIPIITTYISQPFIQTSHLCGTGRAAFHTLKMFKMTQF